MEYDGIKGKVAVVTGSGGGIGEAYAKGLAAQGAHVVVAEIKEDDGERVAREIREQGGEAMFAAVDVGSEASTLALAEEVKGALGGIDLLVNNAAIFGDMKMDSLIGIDYESQEGEVAVNPLFLQHLGSFDAFPGGGNFDQNPIVADAGIVVQTNQLAPFFNRGVGVKTQASIHLR